MIHKIGNSAIDLLTASFNDVIRLRAIYQSSQTAYNFLPDRSEEKTGISYSELDREIRNIAFALQKNAAKGDRAILLFPSGKEYITGFFSCLYSGIIAVPAYPPDPSRLNNTLERLQTIIRDSRAKIALTTSAIYNAIKAMTDVKPGEKNHSVSAKRDHETLLELVNKMMNSLTWIQTDLCEKGNEDFWTDSGIRGDNIAYLQYTSGSTGTPSGVIITHRNLLINSKMIAKAFEVGEGHAGFSWLPMYHDMGLIGGIMQPLFSGFPCTLMSPLAFLARPVRWLKEISLFRDANVVTGGPNFAYELCTRRVNPEQIAGLNLSNWKLAYSGAEPVRWNTIEEFYEKFKLYGFSKEAFYPCYGLAEATLFVSGGKRSENPSVLNLSKAALENNVVRNINRNDEPSAQFVSCGFSREDGTVKIVHPDSLKSCRQDEVGEIWFSGSSCAKGYWNKPAETSDKFMAIADGNNENVYLRTGDLGFIKNGELFITGRLKDLIIIRGKNHYPQDIELTVEKSHKAIRQSCTAAFTIEDKGEETLAVVAEVNTDKDLDYNQIFSAISDLISTEHELQVSRIILIKSKTIFKTSSGKIQRKTTKNALLNNKLEILSQWLSAADSKKIATQDTGKLTASHSSGNTEEYSYVDIVSWIVNHMAERLNLNPRELDINRPFSSYGLDSVMAVELAGELEAYLGRKISSTVAWEYSTINKMAESLSMEKSNKKKPYSPVKHKTVEPDDVVIVGLACRFPGANNPDELWEVLKNGVDAISEIPSERWDLKDYYSDDQNEPGKMNTKWGGFLKDIDKFDPAFFGISPREALNMDPQQRILLEVLWEAFENGGIIAEKLSGSRTGVFIGISNHDYSHRQFENPEGLDVYSGTGNAFSIAANRISYLFDFRGPSLAIDTACSSSLVAMHLATQCLLNGEIDMAVVGGVNAILTPAVNIVLSKGKMLSPDGHCKSFDSEANGYVRSEGCGVVILKRKAEAQKDNNKILAIVRGSAINQDGHSNGLTAPNKIAQQEVLSEALKAANVSVDQVGYIEAHGTGTILGDPIEVEAIKEVFRHRNIKDPLVIGSVKANIGHLESAAGIAGIIKSVLMLKNGAIPANINFKKLNPHINLSDANIKITGSYTEWKKNGQNRIAGISSFGFGGVNAHVILEEYPEAEKAKNSVERTLHLLTLSAKYESALVTLAERYQKELLGKDDEFFTNLCYSANTTRQHFNFRASLCAENTGQMHEKLQALINKENMSGVNKGEVILKSKPKIAFLFTGQGAQYVEMGKVLYLTNPLFREIFDSCDLILKSYLEKSLFEVVFSATGDPESIGNTCYTQPALFVIEYALAKLWISWGIKPDYMIGHSIGEYAAACIAGVFTLEDALKLVSARGRLMQSLPKDGEMAVIFTNAEEVKNAIREFEEKVSIAAINGPANTVISGERNSVRQIVKRFEEDGKRSHLLAVSHAFHSPLMDPILDEFEKTAEQVRFNFPRIPVISNLTGNILDRSQVPDAEYWTNHIRQTVLFSDSIESLVHLKTDIFIEIGPGPILIGMAGSCVPQSNALWLPSLKKGHDDWKVLLESLSKLYIKGIEIDWEGFDLYYSRSFIKLPNYPFRKERFWAERKTTGRENTGSIYSIEGEKKISPLVHSRILSPAIKDIVYAARLNPKNFRLLNEHRILGVPVMPAAGYIEMISSIVNDLDEKSEFQIKNLNIVEAIVAPETDITNIQVVLSRFNNSISHFQVYSALSKSSETKADLLWKLSATGEIELTAGTSALQTDKFSFGEIKNKYSHELNTDSFYGNLRTIGFEHGEIFRVLRQIFSKEGHALGHVNLSETSEAGLFYMHPALLDGGIQLFLATFNETASGELSNEAIYLPAGFESCSIYKKNSSKLWVHIVRKDEAYQDKKVLSCDLKWFTEDGQLAAELIGLKFKHTSIDLLSGLLNSKNDHLLYRVDWRKQPLKENIKQTDMERKTFLIFSDKTGISQILIESLKNRALRIITVNRGDQYRQNTGSSFEVNPRDPENMQRLFDEIYSNESSLPDQILYMWGLDEISDHSRDTGFAGLPEFTSLNALLQIIRKLIPQEKIVLPQLLLVTSESQYVSKTDTVKNVYQSALWGFGKVLALEHPEMKCRVIDLDTHEIKNDITQLLKEIFSGDKESEIAFRDNLRYVPRLSLMDSEAAGKKDTAVKVMERLEISKRGMLSNLFVNKSDAPMPGDDEVEIAVKATGLNFRDVINALGLYPGDPGMLGGECSGIVTAVGKNVINLKTGDEVMGIAPGCFSNYAITKSELLVTKPESITFTEAATIPIVYLTTYYALHKLAGISKGKKILIHSATGGVGLSAIELARLAGAEIFATAGSDLKREFLKSLGIKYIMNSRDTNYADEIMTITEGKGVDIVLNSLNGDHISKGLSILSEKGCFLEIGKTGIWDLEKVRSFRSDVAYYKIALDSLSENDPSIVQNMLTEIKDKLEKNEIKPLKYHLYPFSKVKDAFRLMLKAKHIGKIIIQQDNSKNTFNSKTPFEIKRDGTYLVTGGLGALGLEAAGYLASKVAANIILLSRHSADEAKQKRIDKLQEYGTKITVVNADISNPAELQKVFTDLKLADNLKGIIHAAGVLDDGVILQQTEDKFAKVFSAKVNGTVNLHNLIHNYNLDFIVYFSSITSIIGSPGQSNYAAANSFLDSFARCQRSMGIPATVINWSPWKDLGMALNMTAKKDSHNPIGSISPRQALQAMEKIIKEDYQQAVVLSIDWKAFSLKYKDFYLPPIVSDFVEFEETFNDETSNQKKPEFILMLESIPFRQRQRKVIEFLQGHTVQVLGIDPGSSPDINRPLQELGLDSLMAIELKNAISGALGKDLPITAVFNYPTIKALSGYILNDVLGMVSEQTLEDEQASDSEQNSTPKVAEVLKQIEDLSEAAAEELLLKKLNFRKAN